MRLKPIAALVLAAFLQSSSLASSVTKTFKGSPNQVFTAVEKALRENPHIISVQPSHQELRIRFTGPRISWGEHYSALAGDATITPGIADKCVTSGRQCGILRSDHPYGIGQEPS